MVVAVAWDDLPDWLPPWCRRHLSSDPVDVLFQLHQLSTVVGLRLADGADVVVKARADDGRVVSCVAAQARLAERGFPCARPLTAVSETFLAAYQDQRGPSSTAAEQEIAWAASVWPAAHDVRWEALHGARQECGTALRGQTAERLRRADA